MSATDAMVSRLQREIEERRTFQDRLIETAQEAGRDLNDQEMELYQNASNRIGELDRQLTPLQEGVRIARESATRSRELQDAYGEARDGKRIAKVEYRTAGAFIVDKWQAGAGLEDAKVRLALYERAASHQTTPDNLGVIPEPVVGTVLDFIDSSRPIVSALGPQSVPGGMFKRPRVTQHTDVGPQVSEKTELVSRKMLITSTPVTMATYGGYVNVSRQNIDWSTPSIMDLVVNDLAAQYAITTEGVAASILETDSTPQVPALPATPTAEDVAAAVWKAAGASYGTMQGAGRLFLAVAPDMLGVIGPLFAPVNPQNAQSTGFNAGSFAQGVMGSIGGIPVVMSAALTAGTVLMINTAAAEAYEQRIGTLSVTEPSVLGVQVAYAGYFQAIVLEQAAIIRLDAAL